MWGRGVQRDGAWLVTRMIAQRDAVVAMVGMQRGLLDQGDAREQK